MENQTPPTLRVGPISQQIYVPTETQYHTNDNNVTVNFTGISIYIAPPPHQYPTWDRFTEATNQITTVTPFASLYPRIIQMNFIIYPDTVFAKKYKHQVKGDKKMVYHKFFSN